MTSQGKFTKAYATIHTALVKAQADRELRTEPVSGEPGWAVWERLVVWGEVNRLRFKAQMPPIHPNSILAVESLANGHYDYTHKFALGAAELVFSDHRQEGV